ncbi:bifunctional hydroxymethylpyrimidine kinase/phosphomethylpyrimidine kinase [Sphingobium sp. SCG-1]|uniref:bifunctional hydroxymethylpyrimidine kinase/phosphomethylpyrimidine kinase n=1 Tax=Sphingobium sp. SCG-1 TaxID=2072936 RepID=UPI000CD696D8|nr:bifunctional hydroxymethylpyrimidine kinase/phosphomethylpyrimidine kinase [Sphingobium sp. SCG-1]AUW60198.1 bifunctional hydroxymethylpyrimidine kinase/phosphomethylpyrimidine kinase [Sphingobium sp. SCG-1]
MMIPRVLIIAGSDSGGGAGIQADVKTVTMLGGHAMTAITAITAQNTLGVQGVHAIPAPMVIDQIDSVANDLGIDAIKIGMIGSPQTAHAVADRLADLRDIPIIFDPVMVATSGATLADTATVAAFERLMGMALLITPNVPELAALTGMDIETVDALEEAGQALARRFGCAVLAKGGHLPDQPQDDEPSVHDLLIRASGVSEYRMARIETRHTHGTGCTLASAIATGIARRLSVENAVDRAEAFVAGALHHAPGLGKGHGPLGHAMGTTPFYYTLATTNEQGFDAAALAAQWDDHA